MTLRLVPQDTTNKLLPSLIYTQYQCCPFSHTMQERTSVKTVQNINHKNQATLPLIPEHQHDKVITQVLITTPVTCYLSYFATLSLPYQHLTTCHLSTVIPHTLPATPTPLTTADDDLLWMYVGEFVSIVVVVAPEVRVGLHCYQMRAVGVVGEVGPCGDVCLESHSQRR